MMRSIGHHRHHDARIIARRLFIVLAIWPSSYYRANGYPHPHRLAKWNLTCGCALCRLAHGGARYRRNREKRRASEWLVLAWGDGV